MSVLSLETTFVRKKFTGTAEVAKVNWMRKSGGDLEPISVDWSDKGVFRVYSGRASDAVLRSLLQLGGTHIRVRYHEDGVQIFEENYARGDIHLTDTPNPILHWLTSVSLGSLLFFDGVFEHLADTSQTPPRNVGATSGVPPVPAYSTAMPPSRKRKTTSPVDE